MLLTALADGRAVDYESFIAGRFTATRCNHRRIVRWGARFRRPPGQCRSLLFSARSPHDHPYAQTSSNGPESLSVEEHSHADNGCYPAQAIPARSPDGLRLKISKPHSLHSQHTVPLFFLDV